MTVNIDSLNSQAPSARESTEWVRTHGWIKKDVPEIIVYGERDGRANNAIRGGFFWREVVGVWGTVRVQCREGTNGDEWELTDDGGF